MRLTLPRFVEPQLATLVDAPPQGEDWLHEIKYDGYRALASVAGERVVIRTRNGLDWTSKFRALVPALQALPCDNALLDGEIAVADEAGHTDFGALQDALSENGSGQAGRMAYYLFDLLELNGEDLRKQPLTARKAALRTLLTSTGQGPLVYSDHVRGGAEEVFAHACKMKLEGLISKQADAPYRPGRSRSWLKSKCGFEQEFVVIGWRPSAKKGRAFSSLLLAVREGGHYRYAGRVGTGYSGAGLQRLSKQFEALARKTAPVPDVPPAIARQARFVEPKLVAEIAFRGWTRDGLIRQGAFKGLRADKPAREIVRETPMPTRKTANDSAEEIDGVRVTHPNKVLFAAHGVTKRELIAHYQAVAKWMLPHIVKRPISLVRCPQGASGSCFYQKHASDGFPDEFKSIAIREKSGTDRYLYIEDESGLIASVQVGVLELHLWGCHVDEVEKPDRLIFDFDPDEGLDFAQVKQAAKEMRARLKALGLESFAMVTGGKGVHVIAPLKRGHSWDEHRDFAEALARLMAQEQPDRFVATMSKAKRRGKIFIDYLRNQRGATAICPFSTRARPGAYVALPVSWERLARLQDAHPAAVDEVVKFMGRSDPWPDYFKLRQTLPKLKT